MTNIICISKKASQSSIEGNFVFHLDHNLAEKQKGMYLVKASFDVSK